MEQFNELYKDVLQYCGWIKILSVLKTSRNNGKYNPP